MKADLNGARSVKIMQDCEEIDQRWKVILWEAVGSGTLKAGHKGAAVAAEPIL